MCQKFAKELKKELYSQKLAFGDPVYKAEKVDEVIEKYEKLIKSLKDKNKKLEEEVTNYRWGDTMNNGGVMDCY